MTSLARALLEAKFRGVTAHLAPLGRAAAAIVPPEWRLDAVVAVPLAPRRERRRGFNQAREAARPVAAALGVPLPPRVLVVDDVTTTGATLAAVAAALLDGGAEHVFALALARED